MSIIFNKLNDAVQFIGQHHVIQDTKEVNDIRLEYYDISQEKLKRLCQSATVGSIKYKNKKTKNVFEKVLNFFKSIIGREVIDPVVYEHLALGIEAFSAVPADLQEGAYLYPQQIQVAIGLTQRSLIQMDTGEGKTYALLPAAFALACKYNQIYIICANEYLAWRDAKRTKLYWDFVGLSLGLSIKGTEIIEWEKRVIYTTLETLIFHALWNEVAKEKPLCPITYGAVILDEADAILLDQAKEVYAVVHSLKAKSFDWDKSIKIATTLVTEIDILVNKENRSANLTLEGEKKLKKYLTKSNKSNSEFLILRQTVEISFIAIFVVEEGKDYIVENETIQPINPINGKIERGKTFYWQMPLEYKRGFNSRAKNITLNDLYPEIFLNDFEHVSGLSGTIKEDSLEYLFSYQMPSVVIPPKKPRQKGLQNDLVYFTKEESLRAAYKEALFVINSNRPVLIGTQNISDAENLFQSFINSDSGLIPKLLTGRNDQEIFEVMSCAGHSKSIVITTQLAGRGVDIRLSQESRENGGLHLICIEHALDMRHDRQFLGRAGRQGDPWTARFFCSYDDSLLAMFVGEGVKQFMRSLGMERDQAIEASMVTKSIHNAQQRMREHDFLLRRQKYSLNIAFSEIRPLVKIWFEQVRYFPSSKNTEDDELVNEKIVASISWLIERYIEVNFQSVLKSESDISHEKASYITKQIRHITDPLHFNESDLEGRSGKSALKFIKKWLQKTLVKKIQASFELKNISYERIDCCRKNVNNLPFKILKIDQKFASNIAPENIYNLDFSVDNTGKLTKIDKLKSDNYLFYFDNVDYEINKLRKLLKKTEKYTYESTKKSDKFSSLVQEIETILNELKIHRELLSKICDDSIFLDRTPLTIAYWTVQLAWVGFIEESHRIKHQIFQANYSTMESYRIIYDNIISDWSKREASLPENLLRNLLLADTPSKLNDLFWLEDHAETSSSYEKQSDYKWDTSQENVDKDPNNSKKHNILIEQFISMGELEEDEYFSKRSLQQLLNDFLQESPINTLQTPSRIQSSLENWFIREGNRGITAKRKKINRYWIRKFLIYLNDKGLIGSLPAFRHKVKSFANRFVKAMSEIKTAISVIGTGIFVVVFLLLSFVNVDGNISLSDGYKLYFESLVFGGLLTAGAVTAPAFSSLIFSNLFMYAFLPKLARTPRGIGFDVYIVLFFQIVISWFLLSWNVDSTVSILISTGVFLGILLFSRFTQNITVMLENEVGLSLIGIWLCYTSSIVAIPYILSISSGLLSYYLSTFIIVGLFIFWRHFNFVEIVLSSTRIKDNHMDKEDVNTPVKLEGHTGLLPHIYALLLSISFFELFTVLYHPPYLSGSYIHEYFQYIAIVIYALVFIIINTITINKRLSPKLWELALNSKYQLIKGCKSQSERKKLFRKISFQLKLKENIFNVIVVIFISWLLKDEIDPLTGFPLSILLLFTMYLFSYYANDAVLQLYKLIFSRTPLSNTPLDLSLIKDESKDSDIWGRIKTILSNRISLILTILLIIIQAFTVILRGWDFFKTMGN